MLASTMSMACHNMYKHGSVSRTRLFLCLTERKDGECGIDYAVSRTLVTKVGDDIIAPLQTHVWGCSSHLLADV